MTFSEKYALKKISNIKESQQFTVRFLFCHKKDYKLQGTGVLISVAKEKFLLTAAHVFDDDKELMIPLSDNNLFVPGGTWIFNNFNGNREKDKLDIAILKLDEESANELGSKYSFLTEENLLLNHNPTNLFLYTFFGYPETFSRFRQSKGSFHCKAFFHFNFVCEDKIYLELDRSKQTNIIVNYNKQKSINYKLKTLAVGPDLFGMSGCGLWFTEPENIEIENIKPKLVAIMTDWPIKNRNCVVGTKIDVIIETIRKEFGINLINQTR